MTDLLNERPDLVEAEGLIHLVNPAQAEFTLCGDAFDMGSEEDGYEWHETERVTVNCPLCVQIIRGCRHVRTRLSEPRP